MPHSGKTITFATDLLPNEDDIYSLGTNEANNVKRWIIHASEIHGPLTGNATTATTLSTPRTLLVDLESTNASTGFDGSANIADIGVNGVLPISNGGTGKANWTQYGIIYASGTTTLAQVAAGGASNAYQPLISDGSAAPKWYGGLSLEGSGTANAPYSAIFANSVSVDGTTTLSSNVGIGAAVDSNFQLYVNGDSKFNGNIIPNTTNEYYLGDNTTNAEKRWKGLYVGTADTYGDVYTPIYWNDGVPTEVDVVKKYTFSIA